MRRMIAILLIGGMIAVLSACGAKEEKSEETQIQVFVAASLGKVMEEVAEAYEKEHPEVKITMSADSSGTLMTQIEEGYTCDVFFSAAKKQMDQLEADGLLVEGSRADVVNNQVVVIALKGSGTKVTGLSDLGEAENIALADGSVPVGKYTRNALVKLGILPETEDPAIYKTEEISAALGNAEISEQGNASKVLTAVTEGACEVGTTYYSDTYGWEDQLDILEYVSNNLTGDVIYPIAQVVNEEATKDEVNAAADFISFVSGDAAKAIFEKYLFDVNI